MGGLTAEFMLVLLYIDPGFGFLALQLLAASLMGAAFYFRRTTSQILRHVRLIFRRKDGEDPDGQGNGTR